MVSADGKSKSEKYSVKQIVESGSKDRYSIS